MTKKIRRIFLLSALTIFLLITPCLLAYSWGYAFSWQEKKPVLTGSFYFKSVPSKAQIYLNGKFKKNTPGLISRLLPQKYQVEIKKQNYQSWQKELEIKTGLVTEARNILLIPQQIPVETILSSLPDDFNLEEYLADPDDQTAYYLQKPSYIVYKTNRQKTFEEQLNLSPLPEAEYQIIFNGDQVAVLNDQGELYLFNREKQNFELISQQIKNAQFSPSNDKLLYYSNSELWVYYLSEDTSQPRKQTGQKELITRLSQEIKQAVWYRPTEHHIIFSAPQETKIIELDGRFNRNSYSLFPGPVEQIASDLKTKQIYLLSAGQLKTIRIEEK